MVKVVLKSFSKTILQCIITARITGTLRGVPAFCRALVDATTLSPVSPGGGWPLFLDSMLLTSSTLAGTATVLSPVSPSNYALNLVTAAALTFSTVYFPIVALYSGSNVV